jgi:phosphatidylethanolamine/phosphatidyl-N-methylethanolamine N-methyltransferase
VDIDEPQTSVSTLLRDGSRSGPLPFLRGWLRDPMGVGLPFPSSFWTARRLARAALDAAVPGAGPVLELGAGTGSVTRALVELGCPVQHIVAVERDPELCRSLEQQFPGLQVLQGDALVLSRTLARGPASAGVVISGLPMRAIPLAAAVRCYADAFSVMPPDGAIIQYTYGLRPPVDPKAAEPVLEASFVGREWRNFPPMGIWRYSRAQ